MCIRDRYDTVGFLHDVFYEVTSGKIILKGLATYSVIDGKVVDPIIKHSDPLNEITFTAIVSIMIADGVMDLESNYLLNTNE
jgi:hypothetical protein